MIHPNIKVLELEGLQRLFRLVTPPEDEVPQLWLASWPFAPLVKRWSAAHGGSEDHDVCRGCGCGWGCSQKLVSKAFWSRSPRVRVSEQRKLTLSLCESDGHGGGMLLRLIRSGRAGQSALISWTFVRLGSGGQGSFFAEQVRPHLNETKWEKRLSSERIR